MRLSKDVDVNKKEYLKQYQEKNREKIKAQRREYYAKNKERIQQLKKEQYDPEKQRDKRLQKEYGINLDDYKLLLEKQDQRCNCCGIHESELKTANNQHGTKILVVDHCHDTGQVRSLLCNRCNTILGLINEDEKILHDLEHYLLEWKNVKRKLKEHG